MKWNHNIIIGLIFCIPVLGMSQIKEEVIRANRTYEPDVKTIEKSKEEAPVLEEDSIIKQSMKYDIQDVEPVPDFEPTELPTSEIDPLPENKKYDNFIKGGYGNYGRLLVDGYFQYPVQEHHTIGATLFHHSTQGLEDDYDWNSDQAFSEIELFSKSEFEKGEMLITAGFSNQQSNYFGFSEPIDLPLVQTDDLQQTHNQVKVSGNYNYYDTPWLNTISASGGYLWDRFDSKELFADFSVSLAQKDLNVGFINSDFNFYAPLEVSYVNTEFTRLNAQQFSYLTLGVAPRVEWIWNDATQIRLGGKVLYWNESELGENSFEIYPDIRVEHAFAPEFSLFVGANGGLELLSYSKLAQENPYVAPDQTLVPTNNPFSIFAGAKGLLGEHFIYNAQAQYQSLENISYFYKNNFADTTQTGEDLIYNQLNSFSVGYDDGSLLQIAANLEYIAIENLTVGVQANMNTYSLDNLDKIYYRPVVEGKVYGQFKMLNDKLQLGSSIYFVGERFTNDFQVSTDPLNPLVENREITLDSFVDLNLSASYAIMKQLSVFVQGNNLLSSDYERYIHYPVLGLQVMGGVLFKF